YTAPRRAFVADGSAYDWSIHQGYFDTFEPIVDFLHAVCYVFSSAAAVPPDEASGWSQYVAWMRACWQGRVGDVLAERDQWQARLGESPPGEAPTAEERRDPRRVVAPARTYLIHEP
ncbi:LysR family transcriptional regulator, partial [Gemmata sp. JC673]|nr:LysR family transcriptional regulator [Gemmata algarum]